MVQPDGRPQRHGTARTASLTLRRFQKRPIRRRRDDEAAAGRVCTATPAAPDAVKPVAQRAPANGPAGHKLIGYWSGYGPIRDVSPQWDIILVAFATPNRSAGEGQMQYRVSGSTTPDQFKADIKFKQSQGKKVMISLGGGGVPFTLNTPQGKQRFITSVEAICAEFGFDGIDIDFETSALDLDPGDTDPKHPTSPSTVNLIAAMREIHDHFGPQFMLSLVPEGSQTPAGYPGYGGQFGSYLPLIEGIRDILSFVDTQDYNCPPIQGLDGEYYMPGSVNYHAAATELFLHGFDVRTEPEAPLRSLAAGESHRRLPEQRHDAADRGRVDADAADREVEPADHVHDAEAVGLSDVRRRDVLDHRRRPARGVSLLEHRRPPAARQSAEIVEGGEVPGIPRPGDSRWIPGIPRTGKSP